MSLNLPVMVGRRALKNAVERTTQRVKCTPAHTYRHAQMQTGRRADEGKDRRKRMEKDGGREMEAGANAGI